MNWTHFLLWVAGIYLVYYLVNILIDVAGGGNAPAVRSLTNELTFSENVQPRPLHHEPETRSTQKGAGKPASGKHYEPEMIASGGVPISDIFNLARQESIIYTRSVSF
ncbi:MAG: hypothetical protein JWQ66_4471 [Mucilaginibacter sp.]|nr:hypothetical protein [Mucilaginibacter sp.]